MPAPMRVLIHAERPEGVAAAVAERHPDAEVAVCDSFDALPDAAAGIDPHAAYTERFERRPYPREALLSQPSLAFVHVSGAGVNHLAPWDPRKVQVCNAAGVQDEGMALFAIGRLIAVACNFFLYHDQQKRRVWRVHDAARSPGGALTVVGLGRIGRACARAAGALGMTVYGVRARPRPCEGVERVVGPDGLREVLGKADYVIVSTPLTERTRGMIDAAAIAAMKPGAILHDMSRGGVVDGGGARRRAALGACARGLARRLRRGAPSARQPVLGHGQRPRHAARRRHDDLGRLRPPELAGLPRQP